jgi:glycosyltransferase involved in cell wall biosynthesis
LKTISCSAAYGGGGLGLHFKELVEDARARGELASYYTTCPQVNDAAGIVVTEPVARSLIRWTPIRFSSSWSSFIGFDLFDRALARAIEPSETCVGFSLQSLHTFRAAATRGGKRFELVSPTCHVDYVHRQYEEAFGRHPIERSWLNERARRKARREYEAADAIIVASDYVRDSFLDAGIPEEKLVRFDLSAPSRFVPPPQGRPVDGIFRIVYVGSLSVAKGVPVLLDAFSCFEPRDAQLTLVGGWGTRAMRRHVEQRCGRDSRIRIAAGDPLPHLQQANVYIHPSYQDGLGYAPLEALACRVPVILTEDTGAKEFVVDGVNGVVVPTGSADAISGAITEVYRREPQNNMQLSSSEWL